MKTIEEKAKEWDALDKKFKDLKCPSIIRSGKDEELVNIIADDTNDLMTRFKTYFAYFAPMYASQGVTEIFQYVKHAKPFVEFMKIKYPNLLGPENDHGISLGQMHAALQEYREKEKVEMPKLLSLGAFYELFFYLLRYMNLMKEEQVSSQWWWEVLVDKK